MKTCRKCEQTKPLDAFWKKKCAQDGLQNSCIECMSAYSAKRYQEVIEDRKLKSRAYSAANRERKSIYNRRYHQEQKDQVATQRKQYREANKALLAEKNRAWREANPTWVRTYAQTYWAKNKTHLLAERKPYFARNHQRIKGQDPSYFARKSAKRRAMKRQAKPAWANDHKIAEFYETANGLSMLTGEWYHVDHIVPLKGRTVCGLHTEANLQVLPGVENRSKSNYHWPDQP